MTTTPPAVEELVPVAPPSKKIAGIRIEGHVSPGFEPVRDAFAENFARRRELGGACCVYHRGKKVVDLWGGVRHKATGEPWEKDTMVLVCSTTKGLSAMTLAIAHSRGWLDYDACLLEALTSLKRAGADLIFTYGALDAARLLRKASR